MKLNNYPDHTENELDSVAEGHCDEQNNLLMDVLAKPLGSVKHTIDSNQKEITSSEKIDGVVIGKVVTCDASGAVTVDYPDNPADRPLFAASIALISADDINKDVALMFEADNPLRPIIMGRLQRTAKQEEKIPAEAISTEVKDVQLDGKRLTFTAEQEIVLRCGEASITLTRAGKVIIRGEYLLSRSTGTNRIKGGSVQIN